MRCVMEHNKNENQMVNSPMDDSELSKEEQLAQIKKWLNWILIIAGFYFVATGYYGALLPLRNGGASAINGIVIFTGSIAIIGVVMIILGCRIFIKKTDQ